MRIGAICRTLPIVLDGDGGTAVVQEKSSRRRRRIGDLRMRVVYRGLAVVAAVAVAAVGLIFVLPSRPDEAGALRSIAAPSIIPSSSAPAPSAAPSVTPSPGSSIAPGYTAMEALRADARLPVLADKLKLRALPGRPAKVRGTVKDQRSGLAVPLLGKPWKRYGSGVFATRQVLPPAGKARGMLVSCPVPIEAQEHPRDTALLAARWTLNHHPKGAEIAWVASKAVGKGWALVYRVTYGKRSSMAAVVVVNGSKPKPGLAFVTIPDTQKGSWRDINRVVAGVRVLG